MQGGNFIKAEIEQAIKMLYMEKGLEKIESIFDENMIYNSPMDKDTTKGKEEVIKRFQKEIRTFPTSDELVIQNVDVDLLEGDLYFVNACYTIESFKIPIIHKVTMTVSCKEEQIKIKSLHLAFSNDQYEELLDVIRTNFKYQEIAMKNTDMSVWTYDLQKKCIYHDKHSAEIHGFSTVVNNVPEELVACGYVHPKDVPRFLGMYAKMFTGEKQVTGDFWVRPLGKQEYWCERITYTVLFDKDNKPYLALGASKNVTQEKEMGIRYKKELGIMKEREDVIHSTILNLTKNEVEYSKTEDYENADELENKSVDNYFQILKNYLLDSEENQGAQIYLDRKALLKNFQQGDMNCDGRMVMMGKRDPAKWLKYNIHMLERPTTGDVIAFIYMLDITDYVVENRVMKEIVRNNYLQVGVLELRSNMIMELTGLAHKKYPYIDFLQQNLQLEYFQEFKEKVTIPMLQKELEEKENYKIQNVYKTNEKTGCCQWNFWYLDKKKDRVIITVQDIKEA